MDVLQIGSLHNMHELDLDFEDKGSSAESDRLSPSEVCMHDD